MPRSRLKLAIPFVGKDVPSRSSEFAHPDVVLGLSVLAYRYSGMRYTDFDTIMANVCATFEKEVGPYRRRKSSMLYESWIVEAGGAVKGSLAASNNLTDKPSKPPVAEGEGGRKGDGDWIGRAFWRWS